MLLFTWKVWHLIVNCKDHNLIFVGWVTSLRYDDVHNDLKGVSKLKGGFGYFPILCLSFFFEGNYTFLNQFIFCNNSCLFKTLTNRLSTSGLNNILSHLLDFAHYIEVMLLLGPCKFSNVIIYGNGGNGQGKLLFSFDMFCSLVQVISLCPCRHILRKLILISIARWGCMYMEHGLQTFP